MEEIEAKVWYPSVTHKVHTGCGVFYVTIVFNLEGTRPAYLLPHLGKGGGCAIEIGILWKFGLRRIHLEDYANAINKVFAIDDIGERLYQYSKLSRTSCQHGDMCCLHQITRMLFNYDLLMDEHNIKDHEGDED